MPNLADRPLVRLDDGSTCGVEMPMVFAADGTCMLDLETMSVPYDEVTMARLRRVRLRPFAIGAVMEPLSNAAWSTVRSSSVVASEDTLIHPETQREMAARAGVIAEVAHGGFGPSARDDLGVAVAAEGVTPYGLSGAATWGGRPIWRRRSLT